LFGQPPAAHYGVGQNDVPSDHQLMFTNGYPMENGIGIKKRCTDTDRHRDAARM